MAAFASICRFVRRAVCACLLPLLLCLIAHSHSLAQTTIEKNVTSVPPLVSAKQLESLLKEGDLCLLEIGRDKREFESGHIPSAHFLHWLDDLTNPRTPDRFNNIDQPSMEKLLRRCGANNDSHIVIYDDLANRLSTRMYWSLKFYGHQRVSILDGGQQAWQRAGLSLTRKVAPAITPTKYRITKTNPQYATSATAIENMLSNSKWRLVDGRPPKQFSGEEPGKVFHTEKPHKQRGHIPGAANIFWKQNFNKDGTFKSASELRKLYRQVNQPGSTIVTYCNEGLHAAPPWFVLHEILGARDVRVYDDSMSEWANSNREMEVTQP